MCLCVVLTWVNFPDCFCQLKERESLDFYLLFLFAPITFLDKQV